jgi:hypothetical protein
MINKIKGEHSNRKHAVLRCESDWNNKWYIILIWIKIFDGELIVKIIKITLMILWK